MSENNVPETNKSVIERFFHELWNKWDLAVADEIISPSIRFRGSLGTTLEGLQDFKRYVETVRAALPDWHNQIDELIAKGDKVVTRMTYSARTRDDSSTSNLPGIE